MGYSAFLRQRSEAAAALVDLLKQHYGYVSILGVDVTAKTVRADRNTSAIQPGRDTECGFVVKLYDGKVFFEYSLDDIDGDVKQLAEQICRAFCLHASLQDKTVDPVELPDPPLEQVFAREHDLSQYTDQQLLTFVKELVQSITAENAHVLNAIAGISTLEVSKLFLSPNRHLEQNYAWVNGILAAVYKDNGKVVQVREGANYEKVAPVLRELPTLTGKLLQKADKLTTAGTVVPGVYDVITDPSITGLIAHEAFGHGVEMDQFVKDRALAKEYVGDYVASPICNMRDGAAATVSAASYFFDDDGVLAGDTQIIKDGILITGISDLASAAQLGTAPTGNGRRESSRRKAYARMTNTFFEKGNHKLEEMIASIDHGYMLFETSNGMEDPKNWAIQCVAQYGIEIRDGKLTDNYVSPVVMSGYVPDLLKSITMVSDDFHVIGSGMCGKGYKEWVRVSDGGPALKVKVKLG